MGVARGPAPKWRLPPFQRRPESAHLPPSPQQQRFVEEYLVDLSPTNAAVRAGYSHRWAHNTAQRLMRQPHVRRAVEAAKEDRSKRLQITADMVLQELALLAFADLNSEIVKPDVKRAALVDIGRHLNMFVQQVRVTHLAAEMTDEELLGLIRAGGDRASAEAADTSGFDGVVH